MNIQGWFPLGYTGLISLSPRDSQESSPAPQFQSINSLVLILLYGPALTSLHDYQKNDSFDYMDLIKKMMSLLFNMLSLVAQTLKNPPAMQETWVLIPGLGRSPGGGHGNPLQYSCLENPRGQGSLVGCSLLGRKESEYYCATKHSTQVCHNFPSQEQTSFHFVAAVTICSDFGA